MRELDYNFVACARKQILRLQHISSVPGLDYYPFQWLNFFFTVIMVDLEGMGKNAPPPMAQDAFDRGRLSIRKVSICHTIDMNRFDTLKQYCSKLRCMDRSAQIFVHSRYMLN